MSTALDLFTDALTSIGEAGQGQSVSAEMSAQALRVCNRMIAEWSVQRLFLFITNTRPFALTANLQDYVLGPSATGPGAFVGNRPILVEAAEAVLAGSSMYNDLSLADLPKWASIRDLGATTSANGLPQLIYPEYLYPNMAFHLWPIPANACTVVLRTWEQLQQFATIFDTVNFPPGYEKAITLNLALELASYYNRPIPDIMATLAGQSLANVQKINAQSLGGALGQSQLLTTPSLDNPQPAQAQVQPASQPTAGT